MNIIERLARNAMSLSTCCNLDDLTSIEEFCDSNKDNINCGTKFNDENDMMKVADNIVESGRLHVLNVPEKIYHKTSVENLKSIINKGLEVSTDGVVSFSSSPLCNFKGDMYLELDSEKIRRDDSLAETCLIPRWYYKTQYSDEGIVLFNEGRLKGLRERENGFGCSFVKDDIYMQDASLNLADEKEISALCYRKGVENFESYGNRIDKWSVNNNCIKVNEKTVSRILSCGNKTKIKDIIKNTVLKDKEVI